MSDKSKESSSLSNNTTSKSSSTSSSDSKKDLNTTKNVNEEKENQEVPAVQVTDLAQLEKSSDTPKSSSGSSLHETGVDISITPTAKTPESGLNSTEIEMDENNEEKASIENSTDIKPFVNVEVIPDEMEKYPIQALIWTIFKSVLMAILPFFMVIVIGAVVVGCYGGIDDAKEKFFDKLSTFEKKANLLYAFFSYSIFVGLVPFLVTIAFCQVKIRRLWLQVIGTLAFFGFHGVVEFIWLALNNLMNGNIGNGPLRTVMLFLADQSTYSLLYVVPITSVFFVYRKLDFSIVRLGRYMSWHKFIFRDYPLTLAICLFFWVPGMIFCYSMMPNVQFTLRLILQFVTSVTLNVESAIAVCVKGSNDDIEEDLPIEKEE
ncbi:hypothetical protein EIN_182980 [Entamoeba invadens IP1]|uniref:hypothetical protein n=1 Tax=Entamoeba invadens IP1 TaxID=370355 RepID=UPI0002C3DF79|nr:hypothetical protein EIN_182980 [Entamoeba invadens IP1]ELP94041.1 hypothetical protein EIN_182980 [Entamoeba invadens IP1]|eukprot:XP_004260812.1 hypothetical protein EIN_182980 [Entamoeba invadens IP1]